MIQVLVIDDVRQTADSLCQMLSLLDIAARPAYGAKAALLALNEMVPDVVFLDVNMPGLGGFDVLTYLRREPRLYRVPVVVVTSDDQPETAAKMLEAGAAQVLIKPASFETIEGALRATGLIS